MLLNYTIIFKKIIDNNNNFNLTKVLQEFSFNLQNKCKKNSLTSKGLLKTFYLGKSLFKYYQKYLDNNKNIQNVLNIQFDDEINIKQTLIAFLAGYLNHTTYEKLIKLSNLDPTKTTRNDDKINLIFFSNGLDFFYSIYFKTENELINIKCQNIMRYKHNFLKKKYIHFNKTLELNPVFYKLVENLKQKNFNSAIKIK